MQKLKSHPFKVYKKMFNDFRKLKLSFLALLAVVTCRAAQNVSMILPELPVKRLHPVDLDLTQTAKISGDVFFYGLKYDSAKADLDKNGKRDWDEPSELSHNQAGVVVMNENQGLLKADAEGSIIRNLDIGCSGNEAFTVEVMLKINAPSTANYGAAWGFVGNNEQDDSGSLFLISHNHIKVGSAEVSTDAQTAKLNNLVDSVYRFVYIPSGRKDGRGDICIYRNGVPVRCFKNRVMGHDRYFGWLGDWGCKLDGGFTITYLSLCKGAFSPVVDPVESVVTGVAQQKNRFSWDVKNEDYVNSFKVHNRDNNEFLETIIPDGSGHYSVMLANGMHGELTVVYKSGKQEKLSSN